jgi:hypothetical protein
MASALAYLDEAGDLGWKLDKPLHEGGSARYFVVAMAVGINNGHRAFGKVIDRLHKRQNWTSAKEKKWATVGKGPRHSFAELAAAELCETKDAQVYVSVFHKENSPEFLKHVDVKAKHPGKSEAEVQALEMRYRGRTHLTYAMMMVEAFSSFLPEVKTLSYCPDELNEGQRILESIVTYRLNVIDGRSSECRRLEKRATMDKGLVFADMIAGSAWEAFENGDSTYLQMLEPYIKVKEFYAPQSLHNPTLAAIEKIDVALRDDVAILEVGSVGVSSRQ